MQLPAADGGLQHRNSAQHPPSFTRANGERVVAGPQWGPSATTIALPHSAVVVSEELLQSRIAKLVRFDCGRDDSPDWAIISSRPLPDLPMEYTFGQRMATVVPVKLQSLSAPSTCWIESVKEGWLFLLPDGSGAGAKRGSAPPQGWLMSVGGAVDSQLSVSEVVAA